MRRRTCYNPGTLANVATVNEMSLLRLYRLDGIPALCSASTMNVQGFLHVMLYRLAAKLVHRETFQATDQIGTLDQLVRGDLGSAAFCHCSRCRKASGSAFAANVAVDEVAFELTSGKDSLKSFSTAEGVHRFFCSTCGSPITSKRDSVPGVLRLRLGTLDTPADSACPSAHIFIASKADWYEIHDSLPQFAERPAV